MIDIADLYAHQGVSADLCPKHHCRLIQYTGTKQLEARKPVCFQCIEEENDRKLERMRHDMISQRFLRGSLIDDRESLQCTFDQYKPATPREQGLLNQAQAIAMAFAQKPQARHTVLLTGDPGTGKTHLGMSILNNVRENSDQRVLAVSMNKLIIAVKNSWDDPEEKWTESEAIRQMSAGKTDLLLLDDLGTESSMHGDKHATEFVQRILFAVLNQQKRLVVTSNLTLEQLKRVYTPKIVSRLLANSQGTRLNFEGIKDKRIGD